MLREGDTQTGLFIPSSLRASSMVRARLWPGARTLCWTRALVQLFCERNNIRGHCSAWGPQPHQHTRVAGSLLGHSFDLEFISITQFFVRHKFYVLEKPRN